MSGRFDRLPPAVREPARGPVDAVRRGLGRARSIASRMRPRRIWATLGYFSALWSASRRRRRRAGLVIAVDATPLWGSVTGVGWYLHSVLDALRETPDVTFRLFGPLGEEPAVAPPEGPAIEHVVLDVPEDLSLPPGALRLVLRALVPLMIRREAAAVSFGPNFFLPRRFSWSRGPVVLMVHDLASLHFEWTLQDETADDLRRELRDSVRAAARVLTPSEAVREEILEAQLAPPERVVAIHHGPGHLEFDPATPRDGALRGRLGIEGDFALSVGTLEPRKNLQSLLQAWATGHAEGAELPVLVLCGAKGWKNNDLESVFEAGMRDGWLRVPGYVSDEELRQLYLEATVVLQASLYEGFGLPLVEAMAAGVPLVCSEIPVFREVAGDAASYVDATDPAAWLGEVRRLAADPAARERLAAEGAARAAAFDWDVCAATTLRVLREAAEGP